MFILSNDYESTKVDRRTWQYVPSGAFDRTAVTNTPSSWNATRGFCQIWTIMCISIIEPSSVILSQTLYSRNKLKPFVSELFVGILIYRPEKYCFTFYIHICTDERNSSDKYLYMPPFQPQFLPSFRRKNSKLLILFLKLMYMQSHKTPSKAIAIAAAKNL